MVIPEKIVSAQTDIIDPYRIIVRTASGKLITRKFPENEYGSHIEEMVGKLNARIKENSMPQIAWDYWTYIGERNN